MLQEMRKYAKSWVSSIFLGALALSFAVWGIADVFRGSPDTDVFTLGSTTVGVDTFQQEYRDALRSAGVALPPDQAKAMAQHVLDTMTLRTALDVLAQRLGLTVADARLQQQIQAIGAFSGPLGTFDHDKFVAVLAQHGYSEASFVARSRQDTARTQLIRSVEGGFALPEGYARGIFAYIDEQRAVQYITLTGAQAGTVAPPSDAALSAYVAAHPDAFSTPEYRAVSYAGITVDELAPGMTPTPKQIQDEIDANRAKYIKPEKRELEQIKFASEADAAAAKAELDSGKTFDQLATERKQQAGDYKLGEVVKDDLDPARAAAFFALPPGGVTAPVKSTFGWVLMHVGKITAGSSTSTDEIKAIVQKQLAQAKIVDMDNVYTDAVGGGASIEEAAHKAGMHYVHIAAVDAQGLAPDGSKAISPANPELVAAIFKAEVGEDGDPFSTQDGSSFAVRVDGVTPPKVKPLEAVRAQATDRWTAEQKAGALKAKAAALATRANLEGSLAGVAASAGVTVQSSEALNRGTNTGVFTAPVTAAIFKAAPGATVAATADGDTYIVARVTGVAHPEPPPNDLRYMQGASQFGSEVASDITLTLAKAIEKKEGLTVNQKMVDTTVGNSGTGQ